MLPEREREREERERERKREREREDSVLNVVRVHLPSPSTAKPSGPISSPSNNLTAFSRSSLLANPLHS